MDIQPCTLCGQHPATKTNSHIIPSFMIARVCSYDGSGKRDKEVMFTMSTYEDKVYTGKLPSTKIEELFDTSKLTDERIENELKNNTAAKDYIFCPECEKNLSIYLEAPYAEYMYNRAQIDGATAYFFWISIVWRMSISRQFNFHLPPDLENHLQEKLDGYINAKIANDNAAIIELIRTCSFRYRLIDSPDYLNKADGYFGGIYDYDKNIFSYTMGDKILCATFNDDALPTAYSYIGFEKELIKAPINNGLNSESAVRVSKERFAEGVRQTIKEKSFKRLLNEKEKADALWQRLNLPGIGMPNEMFQSFIMRLYSEDSKQGDRKTPERYVELFNETLRSFGFM